MFPPTSVVVAFSVSFCPTNNDYVFYLEPNNQVGAMNTHGSGFPKCRTIIRMMCIILVVFFGSTNVVVWKVSSLAWNPFHLRTTTKQIAITSTIDDSRNTIGSSSSSPIHTMIHNPTTTRRSVFHSVATAAVTVGGGMLLLPPPSSDAAVTTTTTAPTDSFQQQQSRPPPVLAMSDEELGEIIQNDVIQRQFLATGDLTRSIYDPRAKFTDEIDTYEMEQWIQGTQQLFVGSKSHVRLIGNVSVTSRSIEFCFDEDLMFNIPWLYPVVSLSGKVVLDRDESTGYIQSYREFWDQDVISVLKTARFFGN